MQRRAADRGARQKNGIEHCHRGHGSGSTHLKVNLFQKCCGLLGLEFIGNGPPRSFRRCPQLFLLGKGIDFDHHAVDFKRKRFPFFLPFVAEIGYLPHRSAQRRMTAHRKT